MGNIVGDRYRKFVNDQINKRQKVYGKGVKFGEFKTEEENLYLNSKNSWVKIASSVSVEAERLNLMIETGNEALEDVIPGKYLARRYMLFNGFGGFPGMGNTQIEEMWEVDPRATGGTDTAGIEDNSPTGNNPNYGIGNLQEFGFSPMPGIISVDQKCLNRGSLKKTTVKLKAFNKYQFDIIDVLYLRLGYSVFIEFGFDKYYDNEGNYTSGIEVPSLIHDYWFESKYDNSNYAEWNLLIEKTRENTGGNYEGIFGTITNFNWSFAEDGSYDITFEVMSLGDVMESLKVNLPAVLATKLSDSVVNLVVGSQFITQRIQRFKGSVVSKSQFFTSLYPGLAEYLDDWVQYFKDYNTTNGSIGLQAADISTNGESTLFYKYNGSEFDFAKTNNGQLNNSFYMHPIDGSTTYKDSGKLGAWDPPGVREYYRQVTEAIADSSTEFSKKITISGFVGSYGTDVKGTLARYKTLIENTNPYLLVNDNIQNAIQYSINEYLKLTTPEVQTLLNSLNAKTDALDQQALVFKTIPRDDLEQGIFNWFNGKGVTSQGAGLPINPPYTTLRAAGGPQDLQFQDLADLDGIEFSDVAAKMKGLKNRINHYFYQLRKFENRAREFNYSNRRSIYSELININPVSKLTQGIATSIGGCFNPIKGMATPNLSLGSGEWGTVGYPDYDNSPNYMDNVNRDFISLFSMQGQPEYYIRFGVFLEFLNDQVIPKISGNVQVPIIKFDTDIDSNICFTFDNMISLNPKKCIIANKGFYNKPGGRTDDNKSYYAYFEGLNEFINKTNDWKYFYGKIMNIYLNFNRIEEFLEDIDEDGNISLFTLVNNICEDINDCFGNFTNLEPVITEKIVPSNFSGSIEDANSSQLQTGNTIVILDQTYIPGIENIKKEIEGVYEYEPAILDIYGFNSNNNKTEGSFAKKVGLQTQITKEYATMISIGATANGSIPGTEATAFSNWNIGLKDRFKNAIIDSVSPNSNITAQNQATIGYFKTFMKSGISTQGLSLNGSNFVFDTEKFNENYQVFRDFYTYAQAKSVRDNQLKNDSDPSKRKGVSTSIGFLPFNLSLELDGISGLHIYNKLDVNQSFLPSNYPQTLQFIITGIDHEIKNNNWTTKLSTIATVYNSTNTDDAVVYTPEIFGQSYTGPPSPSPSPSPSPVPPLPANVKFVDYKGIRINKHGKMVYKFSTKVKNAKILIDAMDKAGIEDKTIQCAIMSVCAKESQFIKFAEKNYSGTSAGGIGVTFTSRIYKYLEKQGVISAKEKEILAKATDITYAENTGEIAKGVKKRNTTLYKKFNEILGVGKNENPEFTKIKKNNELMWDITYGYISYQNGAHPWAWNKGNSPSKKRSWEKWGFTPEACLENSKNNPNLQKPMYFNKIFAKGDGYMYRGRGFNQITHKTLYAYKSWQAGIKSTDPSSILANPELLTNDLPKSAEFAASFFIGAYEKIKKKKPTDPSTIKGSSATTAFPDKQRAIQAMASSNKGSEIVGLSEDAVVNSMKSFNTFEVI